MTQVSCGIGAGSAGAGGISPLATQRGALNHNIHWLTPRLHDTAFLGGKLELASGKGATQCDPAQPDEARVGINFLSGGQRPTTD